MWPDFISDINNPRIKQARQYNDSIIFVAIYLSYSFFNINPVRDKEE